MSNPDDFDPYRKWLGIPSAEQPPNHYRLLGLGLFEDDVEVIESAVDQRMAHVRTFQTGPHSSHSQKLLDELAAARVTLLNSARKAAYDNLLRAKLAPPSAPGDNEVGSGAPPAPHGPVPVMPSRPNVPRPVPATTLPAPAENVGARAPIHAPVAGKEDAASPVLPSPTDVPLTSRGLRARKRTDPAAWAGLAAAALAVVAFAYWVRDPLKTQTAAVGGADQNALPSKPIEGDRRKASAGALGGGDADEVPLASATSPKPSQSLLPSAAHDGDDSPEGAASQDAGDNRSTEPTKSMPVESVPSATPDSATTTPDEPPQSEPASLASLLQKAERTPLAQVHREAPPEGKALAAAKAAFPQKYGKEIAAAKTREQVWNLRTRLINLAQQGAEPPDMRYVMLLNAGASAANQGSVSAAYRAANEIGRSFDVDPYQTKLKALEAAGKAATMPTAFAVGALQSLALAERAAFEGKFDVANRAATQAANFGRKTKNKELIAQIDRSKAAMREQSLRNAAYLKALADLKKSPSDPAANLTAGKFETLVLGNWHDGLFKLAASNDSQFARIARLEAETRADPSQWAAMTSAWSDAAMSEADEFFQSRCQLQAKYACLRATSLGQIDEIPKEVVEQLRNVAGYPLSRLRPGAAARYFEGADFQRLRAERQDLAIDFFFGQGSPEPTVPTNFFSARWTGFIKPPVGGRYRLRTFTNDGVRLWIDGEQVLNRWRQNADSQEVEVLLTSELHTFQLEYNETIEVAYAIFVWGLADGADPDLSECSTVDALYYDPESPFQLPELKSP